MLKNPSPDRNFSDSTITIDVHVDYEFPRQIETLNNTSNIKKSQPGSKIHKNPDHESICDVMCNVQKFQPGSKILRPESTINTCMCIITIKSRV
jgi:hypothetical protein